MDYKQQAIISSSLTLLPSLTAFGGRNKREEEGDGVAQPSYKNAISACGWPLRICFNQPSPFPRASSTPSSLVFFCLFLIPPLPLPFPHTPSSLFFFSFFLPSPHIFIHRPVKPDFHSSSSSRPLLPPKLRTNGEIMIQAKFFSMERR